MKKDHMKGKMPKGDGNLSPKTKNLPENTKVTNRSGCKKPKLPKK